VREPSPIGSGPFRLVRARLNEEIVLDRFDKHFAVPRWSAGSPHRLNPEATIACCAAASSISSAITARSRGVANLAKDNRTSP